MKKLATELMRNESGLILSAEMVMILTICVLGVVVGLVQVQTAIVNELQDVSLAFSGFNQSYSTPAFFGCRKWSGRTSFTASSGFIDFWDGCIANGSMGGGGFGGGYGGGGFGGGYGEIGGLGYAGSQSTTTVTPQSTTIPCETCPTGTQETLTQPQTSGTGVPQATPQATPQAPLPPAPMPVPDHVSPPSPR